MKELKYFKELILKKDIYLLLLLILILTSIYSFIAISKHRHFQTFAWDTAFFDQQIYFVSNFKAPFTSLSQMNGLGDHFHIVFLVLGTLAYKVWSSPGALFILQSLIVCLSALPLYLISKRVLGKLNFTNIQAITASVLVCLLYLLSVSFQGMVSDEFHNDPLATLPLMFLFYFLLTKNNLGYWICLILLLLTKETYGLFAVPIGLYILLKYRDFKKGFLTIFTGILTFYLLVYTVMPNLAGQSEYFHFNDTNRPTTVAGEIISKPSLAVTKLIDSDYKIETIFNAFFSFGFFPLLSPAELILTLFSLMIRFYDGSTELLYRFNNHYSVPLICFLSLGTIYGIYKSISYLQNKKINGNKIFISLTVYLLLIIFTQNLIQHGPINSLLKPAFYETQVWEKDAHLLISMVPEDKIIASQNSLLPHLSQRDSFYLLPKVENAEYIVVDLEDGPNKFSPSNQKEISALVNNLLQQKKYEIVWQQNQAMLLHRLD